ncbi:hypothetical protein EBU58_07585 [bacterium]|nr:hypothetical protein [bacterium]
MPEDTSTSSSLSRLYCEGTCSPPLLLTWTSPPSSPISPSPRSPSPSPPPSSPSPSPPLRPGMRRVVLMRTSLVPGVQPIITESNRS